MSIFGKSNETMRKLYEQELAKQQAAYARMTMQQQLNAYGMGAPVPKSPAAPATPAEKIEQVETEIIAWRGWRFVQDESEPILQSVSHPVRWDGPSLTADKPPAMGSPHGLYALKVRPKIGENDAGYFRLAAFGEVALSGLVVEGDRGYRAERAIIRSLWVANPACFSHLRETMCSWEIAGLLGQRYDVDTLVAGEDWAKWEEVEKQKTERLQRYSSALGRF